MMCEEFRAAYLSGEASESMDAHRRGCAACRAESVSLEAARRVLAEPLIWEEPSLELAEQVQTLITARPRSTHEADSKMTRRLRFVAVAAIVITLGVGAAFVATRPSEPDWVVSMPGTELAVGATSSVSGWNTDTGTRMVLDIEGLPHAPTGYIYELWLSEGSVHISAGSFTGSGAIELWAGVRRSDYPRLWVTLEKIDEDESPSRTAVLDTQP